MNGIHNPNVVFPNEYKTSCFIKNVITAPNITVGDYTYYDDASDPTGFEKNNVLFNYPEFGGKLIIGKFCQIASGAQFIMGPANHRLCSATTYPFNVFGGAWAESTPPHMDQLPRKGDTVVGNDVWIGRESAIMPGIKIDGELPALLLRFRWWDLDPEPLTEFLPLLCDPDLKKVKQELLNRLQ